jgi:predicted MFS family arabinose efflux permease
VSVSGPPATLISMAVNSTERPGTGAAGTPGSNFRAVLRLREFRLLWLADIQSLLGDQVARVALSVLVFDSTRSGLATAAVYALTFLPALLGSVLLGHLADRLPRRALLVGGDLIRAALLFAMTIPHLSIGVLASLLVLSVLVGTPWKAAESALVVDILPISDYPMGLGLRSATSQAAQLAGFAVGGLAVAVIGPRAALGFDAATFLVSAIVIRIGVRLRPPVTHTPQQSPTSSGGPRRMWLAGPRAVFGDARLRTLLAFSWLLGLIVVPEGLAAPYASQLGGGAQSVGILLASGPAGVLVGTVIYTRCLSAPTRAKLLGPFATAAGLPLLLCLMTPGLVVSCVLWALAGSFTGYQVQVVTEFVRTISPQVRGQGIAIASAGLLGAQGLGLLVGGLITQFAAPTTAIAAAGGTAVVLGGALWVVRNRSNAIGPPTADRNPVA